MQQFNDLRVNITPVHLSAVHGRKPAFSFIKSGSRCLFSTVESAFAVVLGDAMHLNAMAGLAPHNIAWLLLPSLITPLAP
jgi:hypothetical protein